MKRAQRKAYKAEKKDLISRATFRGLGVLVVNGLVYRDDPFRPATLLGPARGASAAITTARVHRAAAAIETAAVLGPAGLLVGSTRKPIAYSVVALPNGQTAGRTYDSRFTITEAQKNAVRFNAVAGSA